MPDQADDNNAELEPRAPSPVDDPPCASAVEVVPTRARPPLQSWVSENRAPLTVLLLWLLIYLFIPPESAPAPADLASSQPVVTLKKTASKPAEAKPEGTTPFGLAVLVMIFGGAVAAVVGAALMAIKSPWGQRLRAYLLALAQRPLPAIRLIDVLAVAAVWIISGLAFDSAILALYKTNSDTRIAIASVTATLSGILAVLVGIELARFRAAGPQGARGFWPFWAPPDNSQTARLSRDILLGILAFPLCIWAVSLASLVNTAIVEALGEPVEEHPVMKELAKHHAPWAIAVVFLLSTVVAAVIEEILFRGILYNALRRYGGRWVGAVASSAIFAYLHALNAGLLPYFLLALLLVWLYDKTGRLVASMALHATNNMIVLALVLSAHQ